MDIQTKDGIILRGIPDGTPDDVIKARIAQIRGGEPSSGTPPTKPLTKDNPNPIDEYLIGKLSQAPGLGNAPEFKAPLQAGLFRAWQTYLLVPCSLALT